MDTKTLIKETKNNNQTNFVSSLAETTWSVGASMWSGAALSGKTL